MNSALLNTPQPDKLIQSIVANKSFGVEYQPIVETSTLNTFAYEALTRFFYQDKAIAPKPIFDHCHACSDTFFDLEMMTKEYHFFHRPKNKTLFVNFDPHILYKKNSIQFLFKYFSRQSDFVIELVENSHKSINIFVLINIFKKLNFQYAVDDFFQDNTMLSICLLNNCDYLKLDKAVLDEMKLNENFGCIVEGIVNFAHNHGKKVILEGVQTQDDIDLAIHQKIDYVQGFYFDDRFIQA